jgi:large subunit ribosomal protein L30
MAKKKTFKIRQVKSGIGYPKDQKATLKGLGFRRMHQVVELEDTPSTRGMVNKVRHLVVVEADKS